MQKVGIYRIHCLDEDERIITDGSPHAPEIEKAQNDIPTYIPNLIRAINRKLDK